ncbi:pyrroline-5-carboxylate reductase, partial [Dietzia sp. DQ11-38-2]|nr:pyrroline-5-carboxylate reductase [Dietzia sp. DQ11-38-2]
AIRRLEAGGVRSAVADAVEASATKSRDLALAAQKADDDERDD